MSEIPSEFRFVLVGDSTVGKTCVMLRFVNDFFSNEPISTVGVDFRSRNVVVDEYEVRCQIWDTAGQERYRTVTNSYYRRAHVILIVYSVADKTSFENVETWLNEIKMNASLDIEIILVGNKIDLEEERCIKKEEAEELANELNIPFFEVSAKTSYGVESLFMSTLRNMIDEKKKIK